jgi:hypothetical protein
MADNIEAKVAQTILQKAVDIEVGSKTYKVAPPSVATIIMVSEYVATLPNVRLDEANALEGVLAVAKDCSAIGDIAAILVLGAKGISARIKRKAKVRVPYLWGLLHRKREVVVEEVVDKKAILAKELLEEYGPTELYRLIYQILNQMQLGDFFGLTTFLCEINLTKPTKVE